MTVQHSEAPFRTSPGVSVTPLHSKDSICIFFCRDRTVPKYFMETGIIPSPGTCTKILWKGDGLTKILRLPSPGKNSEGTGYSPIISSRMPHMYHSGKWYWDTPCRNR